MIKEKGKSKKEKIEFKIQNLKFDEKGLIPAIIQDYKNNEVLMMAFMNDEAVKRTLSTRKAYFYSRSRNKLWLKGETSGHIQEVKEIRFDCDADCLLVKVRQKGGACHTGYRSCFYRKLKDKKGNVTVSGKLVFSPEEVYESKKEEVKRKKKNHKSKF